MKLRITRAIWANPERTAAILRTKERGAVAISRADRPDMWRLLKLWLKAGGIVEPFEHAPRIRGAGEPTYPVPPTEAVLGAPSGPAAKRAKRRAEARRASDSEPTQS